MVWIPKRHGDLRADRQLTGVRMAIELNSGGTQLIKSKAHIVDHAKTL